MAAVSLSGPVASLDSEPAAAPSGGWLRLAWRAPALGLWVLGGLAWVLLIHHRLPASSQRWVVRAFARGVLLWCGVRLEPEIRGPAQPRALVPHPALVVANHVSWIDIYVAHALEPMTFIAKADIARWPVLGRLATAARTVYIERGNRQAIRGVIEAVEARFDAGERVMFFPEGTTSDGLSLLPFHSNLFVVVANRPGLPVVPLTLQYWQAGRPSSRAAYVGEMTLVGSMVQIMRSRGLVARPIVHPPIPGAQQMDRRALAAHAQEVIGQSMASC